MILDDITSSGKSKGPSFEFLQQPHMRLHLEIGRCSTDRQPCPVDRLGLEFLPSDLLIRDLGQANEPV